MVYMVTILIVACAVTWIYLRWVTVRNYWTERRVPHLPPNPILGSLTFLQQQNAGVWMRHMYETFKTPYIGIWLFWRPALIINTPELARQVLVKDSSNFRDRFVSGGDADPIGKLNLFTVKDPEWSNIRRRLTATFTASKLRIMQDFIRAKSKELAQRLEGERDTRIHLKKLYSDYTTDVIGTSAFGVACDATLTGKSHLRSVTEEFMEFSLLRGIGWSSMFFFPELVDVFRFKLFPKTSTDYFKRVFKAAVAQREANHSERGEPKDLLDALLKIKKESEERKEGYSEDFIVAQAAVFLSGGYDTSGSLLAFLTYELAYNPEVQEQLYEYLLEAKKQNGSDDFTSEQLADMTYLNAVIKEGLRKYSPMSWLDRVAAEDYRIDDNLTIKAGTPVYVNGIGMHYDPDYFPDPDKFDPNRFLPENEKNIKPYTYMPFGEGPRVCIGLRFGMMTVRYAMVSVFLNYKVVPFPGMPTPVDMTIDKRGIFYSPGEAICVEFVPRA
ncbi:cytochrome P450 6k1-like [Maniola hyperantus]|uniref:cytochrome P450 6k1-like n=1 Tax=Aphantopus hyperantus TaxID=2795564 RepID=UPI0015687FAC|nr:cytochrome P450 6k1-like [Maniola hyperantus]